MGFGGKRVHISTLPLISCVILCKSFNLSEAHCYNLEYMKAPNIEHSDYYVSVFLMKSPIKGLLFGGILIFVSLPTSGFSRPPVTLSPLVPSEDIHVPMSLAMWERDLRNTATTGEGNLISYPSEV